MTAVENFNGAARALAERDGLDALASALDMVGNALGDSMRIGAVSAKNLRKFAGKRDFWPAVRDIADTLDPLAESMYLASTAAMLAGVLGAFGDDWQFGEGGVVTTATPAMVDLPSEGQAARLHVAGALVAALQTYNRQETMEDYAAAARGVVARPDAVAMVAKHFLGLPFSALLLARGKLRPHFERCGFEGDGALAPIATLAVLSVTRFPFYVRTLDRAALLPLVLASVLRAQHEFSENPKFTIDPHLATVAARLVRHVHGQVRR